MPKFNTTLRGLSLAQLTRQQRLVDATLILLSWLVSSNLTNAISGPNGIADFHRYDHIQLDMEHSLLQLIHANTKLHLYNGL